MHESKPVRSVTLWHFVCPECGVGDRDFAGPVAFEIIHCEVCLEERRFVRLRRWAAEAEDAQVEDGAASGAAPRARARRR